MQGNQATYRLSLDGGRPTLVAPLFARAGLSPDRRLLAGVYRENARAGVSLGVLDVETGKLVKAFPDFSAATAGGMIDWTSDGTSVLYTTVEAFNVWRRRLDGGKPERVTNFSDLIIIRFASSPDGKSLLLCRGSQIWDSFLITGFR
jgi:hypothetical protein